MKAALTIPKFRIGKVVERAIVNILEKVATSPFSLLGALFGGGGEELGYQDFAAGSADADGGGHARNWIRWRRAFTPGRRCNWKFPAALIPTATARACSAPRSTAKSARGSG